MQVNPSTLTETPAIELPINSSLCTKNAGLPQEHFLLLDDLQPISSRTFTTSVFPKSIARSIGLIFFEYFCPNRISSSALSTSNLSLPLGGLE